MQNFLLFLKSFVLSTPENTVAFSGETELGRTFSWYSCFAFDGVHPTTLSSARVLKLLNEGKKRRGLDIPSVKATPSRRGGFTPSESPPQ